MLQTNDGNFQQLGNALLGASHLLLRHPLHGDSEPAAFAVLATLCHGAAARLSELASAVRLDPSTISRHVQTLEAEGYLVRVRDPRDGRSCRLKATAAGRAAINRAAARRVELFRRASAHWRPQDLRTLIGLLNRLSADLKACAGAQATGRRNLGGQGILPDEGGMQR
jgi:DNA-binding MarR family transcriptional regulator